MGFPRQESWSRLPFPSPEDLPYPWIEPESPALQADSLPSEPPGKFKSLRQTSMFGILGLFKFSFFKDYNFFSAMFYKNFNLNFILE